MVRPSKKTTLFRGFGSDKQTQVASVLKMVHEALQEKGYNPVGQIVGYLLSGDPTYITSHRNARTLIGTVERDELLEELVTKYLKR